jgi:hypothetical protein
MVGADVRQVESEIDESIRKMDIWNVKQDVLLARLLVLWRDGLELVHMLAAHAVMFQVEDGLRSSVGRLPGDQMGDGIRIRSGRG